MSFSDNIWEVAQEARAEHITFNMYVRQCMDAYEEVVKDEHQSIHIALRKLDLNPIRDV